MRDVEKVEPSLSDDDNEKHTKQPEMSILSTSATTSANVCSVVGSVVQEIPNGNMRREILIQEEEGGPTVHVHLDAETYPGTAVWMTIRGAHRLLLPGISLRVQGVPVVRAESSVGNTDASILTTTITREMRATNIVIVRAKADSAYLARLLAFPVETLHSLFPGQGAETDQTNVPEGVVRALAPSGAARCEVLRRMCAAEKAAGRLNVLFKNPELAQLRDEMRDFQGWTRGPHAAPFTKKSTWSALLRMENRWCREVDGDEQDCSGDTEAGAQTYPSHHRVVYGGVDVDPSLNLPDTSDERRLRYVEERKRPQILWMLQRIRRLVGCDDALADSTAPPRILRLADIGGGRGDLANAIAAYFAQPEIREKVQVYITVIDVNQTSLDAGRDRAAAAGLGPYMSFVLCDVASDTQVTELLKRESFDLVYGLHCCGGLAEAAVQLALTSSSSFCISTCCFRSNFHLSSLTRLSDSIVASQCSPIVVAPEPTVSVVSASTATKAVLEHQADVNEVCTLAVRVGGRGQHRGIRAMNAMRLVAAEKRFNDLHGGGDIGTEGDAAAIALTTATGDPVRLRTWQETFPVEFSVQNRVMIGTIT